MPVIKMVVIIPNSTLHSIFKEKGKIHGKSNVFEFKSCCGFKVLKLFEEELYLGCDHTGEVTLIENSDPLSPNLQTLFMLYKVG